MEIETINKKIRKVIEFFISVIVATITFIIAVVGIFFMVTMQGVLKLRAKIK